MASTETVDLSKLQKTADTIVRVAIQAGWTARNTSNMGVVLESPGTPHQTIAIPARTGLHQSVARQNIRKIMRYGDQLAVGMLELKADEIVREMETGRKRRIQIDDNEPMSTTEKVIPAVRQTPLAHIPVPTPAPPARVVPAPEPEPERILLSERPWLAKQGTNGEHGYAYESKVTLERRWSDGTIDYKCVACDYTHEKPVSVSRHYGGTKDDKHPDTSKPESVLQTGPYEPAHRPPSDRAQRLIRELKAGMEAIRGKGYDLSTEDKMLEALAEQIVTMRDERRQRDEDTEAGGPLTPEQIIDRVRRLVDGGAYLAQIERMRQMEDELEAVKQQLATANDKALRLQAERKALADLLTEEH